MTGIKVQFGHDSISDGELNASLSDLLMANEVGALASTKGDQAHINTAYFVYSSAMQLYFLSQPTDVHTGNIAANPSVAVAIWSTPEKWGENLQGIQIFGRCEELRLGSEMISAMALFVKRFPAFKSIMKRPGEFRDGVSSRMFVVRPNRARLLDEPRFGRRNYVELSLDA